MKRGGRNLRNDEYLRHKLKHKPDFIRTKRKKMIDIILADYKKNPEFWGPKTFGTQTIKQIVEEHERTH